MATNFEYYKDEILEIANKNDDFGVVNGEVGACCASKCDKCLFYICDGLCSSVSKIQWLYAEHIEQPKLTKRERAFCEAMQTGWISGLYKVAVFSNKKPSNVEYEHGESLFFKVGNESFAIPYKLFNWMKKNEVWAVEDLLKLEVEE